MSIIKIKVIKSKTLSSFFCDTSYLINNSILINTPPNTFNQLSKKNESINDIKYILLTSSNINSYINIPYYYFYKLQNDDKNEFIYSDKKGILKIKRLLMLFFPFDYLKIKFDLDPFYVMKKVFNIGKYNINKIEMNCECKRKNYAYLFNNEKMKIGFIGNTGFCDRIEHLCNNCDYLICSCFLLEGDNYHLGVDDLFLLSLKYKNCKIVVSNLSRKVKKELLKNKEIIILEKHEFNINEED